MQKNSRTRLITADFGSFVIKFFVYLSGDFPNSNKFNELLKIIMERNKIIFKKIKSFSFSFFEKLEKNIFVEIEFYI